MTRVLVVYGSRHGGTKGIAERIGEVLRTRGIDAAVTSADLGDDREVNAADAFVVGSGVYMGSWLKEPLQFIERYEETLAARPLWLFSSGPLPGSSRDTHADDPVENALGPTEGPGSGGRKKVEALVSVVRPRDHRVFQGAFDPHEPPKAFSERVVRIMPAAKKAPSGRRLPGVGRDRGLGRADRGGADTDPGRLIGTAGQPAAGAGTMVRASTGASSTRASPAPPQRMIMP